MTQTNPTWRVDRADGLHPRLREPDDAARRHRARERRHDRPPTASTSPRPSCRRRSGTRPPRRGRRSPRCPIGREYHSTALLLPDGRVLMAGGGQLPGSPARRTRRTREIYSPPYLFKGARPTITTRAAARSSTASTFTVTTPDAASIQSVALIRTPSVTHAFDQNQRYIPLSFTTGTGHADRDHAGARRTRAPPGYYMLFIVNGNGVPSVAMLRPLPGAVGGPARRRPRRPG